jgi:hypothetical protein
MMAGILLHLGNSILGCPAPALFRQGQRSSLFRGFHFGDRVVAARGQASAVEKLSFKPARDTSSQLSCSRQSAPCRRENQ